MTAPDVRLALPGEPLVNGTPANGEVVVRNAGPEVERYELVAVGPLTAWVTLAETEVRIWPDESRTVQVTVLLPVASDPPAGPAEVGVVAIAGDGTWSESRVTVEVAARHQVVVHTPTPHAIHTCRRALVHLAVANAGNSPLAAALVLRDREGRLVHDNPPPGGASIGMPRGSCFTVPLVIRCTKPMWLGKAVARDYTVEAVAEPVNGSAGAVLVQEPLLRRWWLVVLAVVVLAVLVLEGLLRVLAGLVLAVALLALLVVVLRRYTGVVRTGPDGR